MNEERNDIQKMITQALEEIKGAEGENFCLDKVNLALISRKTGLSRSRLRRIKENGFIVPEHRSKGKALGSGLLSGYTGIIDDLLRKGITNSAVSFERLRESGCWSWEQMTNYSRSQLANFSQSKMTNTPAPCFIFSRYDLSSAVSLIRVLPVVRATVLRFLPL